MEQFRIWQVWYLEKESWCILCSDCDLGMNVYAALEELLFCMA